MAGNIQIAKSNVSSADNTLAFSGYASAGPGYSARGTSDNNNFTRFDPEQFRRVDKANYTSPRYNNEAVSDPPSSNLNGYMSAPNLTDRYKTTNNNNGSVTTTIDSVPELWLAKEVRAAEEAKQRAENSPRTIQSEYRRALDKQIADKEMARSTEASLRKQAELKLVSQYPFGRRGEPTMTSVNRTAPVSNGENADKRMTSTYKQSFGYPHAGAQYGSYEGPTYSSSQPRLNKNNIIEKPNSLSASEITYDPIKYKNGLPAEDKYDPWGKPGGGAPMIDPVTGRKFTKTSGQVWYDSVGISEDDRRLQFGDKTRPLTLEQQQIQIEIERERRRWENEMYKSRANDVAGWILQKHRADVARLQHTNVTREKLNVENARRKVIDEHTRSYHDELGRQLEEQEKRARMNKLKDDMAGIQHTKSWDEWWGRPGAGAPNVTNNRHNIDFESTAPTTTVINSLPLNSYFRPRNGNANVDSLIYSKVNSDSNHKNMYDHVQEMRL